MSTKNIFLAHDMNNAGKKTNNLPMTGGMYNPKWDFMNTLENNGKLIVESGEWKFDSGQLIAESGE